MKSNQQTKVSFFHFLKALFQRIRDKKFPLIDNPVSIQTGATSRRELIKNLAVLPVIGFPLFEIMKRIEGSSFAEENLGKLNDGMISSTLTNKKYDVSSLQGTVPKGKIRHVEISRLIPGGNLISGFVYSRDLLYVSALMKKYFTDEKVIEILGLCEASGINTAILRTDDHILRILKEFRRRGGKIQWIAQTYPENDDMSNIKMAVDNGAVGAFVQGGIADKLVKENKLEYLSKAIEYIKGQGLIGGTAGHKIFVPKKCVENGIEPDFFMKTFHHHNYWSAPGPDRRDDGYSWCDSPMEVAEFFKTCKIPWIAYKTLAAGAIKPAEGFKFVFENGADFACVGMFDFQIVENANALLTTLNSDLKRERKWYS